MSCRRPVAPRRGLLRQHAVPKEMWPTLPASVERAYRTATRRASCRLDLRRINVGSKHPEIEEISTHTCPPAGTEAGRASLPAAVARAAVLSLPSSELTLTSSSCLPNPYTTLDSEMLKVRLTGALLSLFRRGCFLMWLTYADPAWFAPPVRLPSVTGASSLVKREVFACVCLSRLNLQYRARS